MSDAPDLAELRRLEAVATKAPWRATSKRTADAIVDPFRPNAHLVYAGRDRPEVRTVTEADAELIASARNALPWLLDRVEELQRENEELRIENRDIFEELKLTTSARDAATGRAVATEARLRAVEAECDAAERDSWTTDALISRYHAADCVAAPVQPEEQP